MNNSYDIRRGNDIDTITYAEMRILLLLLIYPLIVKLSPRDTLERQIAKTFTIFTTRMN